MSKLIKIHHPNIVVDLKYSTEDNFTGHPIMERTDAYLLPAVADSLYRVADGLEKQNLFLVIWDAYRSPDEQMELLKSFSEDRYVAHHSNHAKGIAVDCTLADANKKRIDMGSQFDEFTVKSHDDYNHLSKSQESSRRTLKEIMNKNGFIVSPFEWWHFDYSELINNPTLDVQDV